MSCRFAPLKRVLTTGNSVGTTTNVYAKWTTTTTDPIVVEQQLCKAMPPARWTLTSDTLILHGRRICRPKPLCDQCFIVDSCDYYRLVVSRELKTKNSKLKPHVQH